MGQGGEGGGGGGGEGRWGGQAAGKGLGELALGEAPNLQEPEKEIENSNLIQKHGQPSSTHTSV